MTAGRVSVTAPCFCAQQAGRIVIEVTVQLPTRGQRLLLLVLACVVAAAAVAAWTWGAFSTSADRFTGEWVGPDGRAASRGESRGFTYEVWSRVGPDHCDWESVVFLSVGWPLGTTQGIDLPDSARGYLRDPDDRTRKGAGLDLDAELPAGSRDTGYRTGEVELWFGPDDGERFAYLVDGADVERWPRPAEPAACA